MPNIISQISTTFRSHRKQTDSQIVWTLNWIWLIEATSLNWRNEFIHTHCDISIPKCWKWFPKTKKKRKKKNQAKPKENTHIHAHTHTHRVDLSGKNVFNIDIDTKHKQLLSLTLSIFCLIEIFSRANHLNAGHNLFGEI